MKSSEERIDEELRKALTERFDNFERLPDPGLREKIFKELGGGTSLVQAGLIASLLLLISVTGLVYFVASSRSQEHVALTHAAASTQQERPGKRAALHSHESESAGQEKVMDQTNVPENLSEAAEANAAERVSAAQAELPAQKDISAPAEKHIQTKTSRDKTRRITGRTPSSRKIDEGQRLPGDAPSYKAPLTVRELPDVQLANAQLADVQLADVQSDTPIITADRKTLEGPSVADQDIGVLDHRPLALPQYQWQPDTLVTPGEPKKRYEYLFRERWSIIAGVTPLRTFQILTVRPGNGVVYQNFVLPAKISAETVGYKFSAGVERKGFQMLVNYGQFRQSYRYEIATSEFEVGPDLSGNYEVIRKGIPQEENSTVRLVGLAVKKHTVRRSHFLRDYFGDVGAEFNRDLTSKRNMVWVNAGFGKELFAGNNVVMTVGPYIEYSLTKLRNPDNPFKIQPYQIGLSVGLRYMKK